MLVLNMRKSPFDKCSMYIWHSSCNHRDEGEIQRGKIFGSAKNRGDPELLSRELTVLWSKL